MREPVSFMSHQRPVERLEPLLASFAASDLTHLELRDGEFAVEFVRRNPSRVPQAAGPSTPTPVLAVAPAPVSAIGLASAPPNEHIVRAELVGVIRMLKPGLSAGMVFERDRDVATIESLGVKTPVRCGGEGRVTRVLANDGDAVDYGQALFVVERV